MTQPAREESYAADLVRRMDPDRYYSALLAPAQRRGALYALYALDSEIGRIHAAASESAAGLLRLKWWHETVSELAAGEPASHPVLGAIAPFLKNKTFEIEPLLGAVEAHEADLLELPFETRADLAQYLDQTGGWIMGLAAGALGASEECAPCLREAGRAWGFIRLLRMLPHQAAKGRCMLPGDLLHAHGVEPGAVLTGQLTPDLDAVLGGLRQEARSAFRAMRTELGTVPKPARAAIAHLTLVPAYLRRMEVRGFDPFRTETRLMDLTRISRIGWSALTGNV